MIKQSKSVYIIGSIIIGIISILGILAGLILGGVLDSTPKRLVFTTAGIEKTYTGEAQGIDKWELVSGELREGHKAVVTITGEQTSVGSSENVFDVIILDERGADVTSDYEIVKNPGILTVTARKVEILAGSYERTYNGEPLSLQEYQKIAGDFVEGHVAIPVYVGEITDVGECANVVSFTIEDAEGNDVTSNYNLVITNGLLKINPIKITIQSGNVIGDYTAQPLTSTNDNFKIISGAQNILDGHEVSIECISSQTIVGSCENEFIPKVTFLEEDLTKNYDITTIFGEITVEPRLVTVVASSNEKQYDATALVDGNITSDDLYFDKVAEKWIIYATGEEFTYQTLGSIIDVGTGENNLIYEIFTKDNLSSNSNYIVNVESGYLTITPRVIYLTTGSDKNQYDGAELTNNEITSGDMYFNEESGKWVITSTGEELDYEALGVIIDVGTAKNNIDCVIKKANGDLSNSNYEVIVNEGTLEITPRIISLISGSAIKQYDGADLTNNDITSGDMYFDADANKWIINVTNEEFIYEALGVITDVGTANNNIDYVIKKANGDLSNGNYEVIVNEGTLEITPRIISLISGSAEKQYDGAELTNNDITSGDMYFDADANRWIINVTNEEFIYEALGTITYVGTADNNIDYVIKKANGDLSNNNYEVIVNEGKLEVTKREITITTGSAEKQYDATELTNSEITSSDMYFDAEANKWIINVTNEEFIYEALGTIIEVGKRGNNISYTVLSEQGFNTTSNYDVTVVEGELEVTKRVITVTTGSAEKQYDGAELTNNEITSGDMYFDTGANKWIITSTDEEFTYEAIGTITNVGVVKNGIKYEIFNKNNENSTLNYDVKVVEGDLYIAKRNITVVSGSAEKQYDATELTNSEITSTDLYFDAFLGKWFVNVTNEEFDYEALGTITNVGEENNHISHKIINKEGYSSNDNYSVAVIYGKLKITKRNITVVTGSAEKQYDATELKCNEITSTDMYFDTGANKWVITSTGEEFDYEAIGSIIDVGNKYNDLWYNVINREGNNSNNNYEVTVEKGSLNVTKRVITVTTGSAEKQYDATELTNNEITSTDMYFDAFLGKWFVNVTNEEFIYEALGTITNVGEANNKISVVIRKANGNVSNENYEVIVKEGSLTVTPRVISVVTGSAEKQYDGAELTNNEITSTDMYFDERSGKWFVNVTNEEFIYEALGTITYVGTASNNIDYVIKKANGDLSNNNYDVIVNEGKLEVTKREITITTGSAEKQYDATELTNSEITSADLYFDEESGKWFVNVTNEEFIHRSISSIVTYGKVDNYISYDIVKQDGSKSNANYKVNVITGELRIQRRTITISTDSAKKQYDATPLTNNGISSGDLRYDDKNDKWFVNVTNEEFTYESTSSIVDVGAVNNLIYHNILYSNGESSNNNYNVIIDAGKLTIDKREIIVRSGSATKEYNKNPLTNSDILSSDLYFDEESGKWFVNVTNEEFNYEAVGTITDVGKLYNPIIYAITKADGSDSTANYNVKVIEGILNVTPMLLYYTTNSDIAVYDGMAHSNPTITSDFIVFDEETSSWIITATGDKFVITHYSQLVNAGEIDNQIEFDILNELNESVIDNYAIGYANIGKIIVTPATVYLTSETKTEIYDGVTNHYCFADGAKVVGLIDGQEASISALDMSILEVGTINNLVKIDSIKNGFENIPLSNYEIINQFGTITIEKRKITISTGDGVLKYNGLKQEYNRYSEPENLVPGHSIKQDSLVFIKHVNAGTYDNEVDLSLIRIIDESENDVTKNYELISSFGKVIIVPKDVIIETNSATKAYDGTELTCHEYTVNYQYCLVEGHEIEVVFTGVQLGIGSSKNTAFVSMVVDENGVEVGLSNYNFNYKLGDLVVYGSFGEEGEDLPDPNGGKDFELEDMPLYQVTSEYGGRIYLKQYVYGDYLEDENGNYGWVTASVYRDATVNPQHFAYAGLSKTQTSYSVEIIRLNSAVPYAIPYYTDLSSEDMKSDTYITKSTLSYVVNYVPFNMSYPYGITVSGTGYEGAELAYRNFVYQNYARKTLQKSTLKVLDNIIATNNLNPNDPYVVGKVANLVSNHVKYNAKTPAYGGDGVAYFFLHAETGKCTHYATAATALFRALGIPARYVLGMTALVEPNKQTIIKSPGHAWVEVYFDGLGWIPVEVTGSDEGDGDNFEDSGIVIKPFDIFNDYNVSSNPRIIYYNDDKLQSAELARLCQENNYTYKFSVSGQQNGIGLSYSEITNFVLYDEDGVDITSKYKFTFNKGILQNYLSEITVQTEMSKHSSSIVYDGQTHTVEPTEDNYSIDGTMLEGHFIKQITFKVNAKDVGKYSIAIDKFVISDQDGNDVTNYYKVNKIYGFLTIVRRDQEVTAGSMSITFDQLFEDFDGTLTYPHQEFTNLIGHKVSVTCDGEISGIGTADNAVIKVVITDEKGKDVTKNYKIETFLGELEVTF